MIIYKYEMGVICMKCGRRYGEHFGLGCPDTGKLEFTPMGDIKPIKKEEQLNLFEGEF